MNPTFDRWFGPALLAAWAALTILQHWGSWSVDLSALYFSARFFGADPVLVYNDALIADWIAVRDQFGHDGETLAPYIYPPWVAGVLAPIARAFSPQTFFNTGYVVHVAAVVAGVLLASRIARPEWMTLTVWCGISVALLATSFVSTFSIDLNQPQNLVNALTLGCFALVLSGRSGWAGAALGAAAAIKLSPAVFVLVLLAERQWRAAGAFAATLAMFVAFNWMVSPTGYGEAFVATIDRIGDQVLLSKINHSVETMLYALTGPGLTYTGGWEWVDAPGWIDPFTRVLLVVGIGAGLWLTRAHPSGPRLWLRIQITAMVAFLTGPLSWSHYLILPMLLLPGLTGVVGTRPAFAAIAVLGVVFSLPVITLMLDPGVSGTVPMLWGLGWAVAALAGMFAIAVRQRPPNTGGTPHKP